MGDEFFYEEYFCVGFGLGSPKDTVARKVNVLLTITKTAPLVIGTTEDTSILRIFTMDIFVLAVVLLCLTDALCRSMDSATGIGHHLGGVSRVVVFIVVTNDCAPMYLVILRKHANCVLYTLM